MSARDYFKGKRIAVVGLGPHGEMIADIRFLIKSGAIVSLYDMRSESRLKTEIAYLQSIGLAGNVCGSVPPEDLLDMDIVLLSHDYPRESSFLMPAQKAGVVIEYSETLFFRLAPPVMLIGVVGTCGKSTVISMLAPMLQHVSKEASQGFFLIDPDSEDGTLSYIRKVKNTDVVLMRITEQMLGELYSMRISPHVAIFTSIPDKGSYKESPFEILSYQTYNNFLIASDEIIDSTHNFGFQPRAKMLRTKPSILSSDWQFNGRGEHDIANASLSVQAARLFKVPEDIIRECLEEWKPLKGRLEFVKKVRFVEFYNDSASTSADSTESAVRSLSREKKLILIFGGSDKGADYSRLYSIFPKYVKCLILLPGSGTIKERKNINAIDGMEIISVSTLEDAVLKSLDIAEKGDRVLFSPGFGAGGFDRSRDERGKRFVSAVKSIKAPGSVKATISSQPTVEINS